MNEVQEKLGIDHLEPIAMMALEVGNVADKMGRSKGMERYFHLTSLFDEMTALSSVDFKKAKAQFKDLDEAEMETLMSKAKPKFDIADDKLEMAIEEGLDIMIDLYSAIDRSIELVKKFKA